MEYMEGRGGGRKEGKTEGERERKRVNFLVCTHVDIRRRDLNILVIMT